MQETIEGLEEVRQLANQFAAERLRPHIERWDHARSVDDEVFAELAELGFHGMRVPEADGGLAFPLATYTAVVEEIAWGEPVAAFALLASASAATTLARGSMTRWLGALAGGEVSGAVPLAQVGGQGIHAERSGNGWKLDGTVRWVLQSGTSSVLVLPAASPDGPVRIAVAGNAEGVRVIGRETTIGLRAARIETIALSAARVGDDAVAKAAGDEDAAIVEQLGTAAIATGIARAALEHAIGYADVREQFGRKLRAFEGIRVKLADMSSRVLAARSMLEACAARATAPAAASVKVFASEAAMWVTTQAVQIFGGYGYMRDYPVEKLMRDAKTTEILTGTNDALRQIVAAGLYGE